jgi:hypothetical protein
VLSGTVLGLGWLSAASAEAASSVSSNWAGYVAVPSAKVGSSFSSVSGTWTVPAVSCTAGRQTYSAAWVGLGGFHENSSALEQIGTNAECNSAGTAVYSTWYELVPAGPVNLRAGVHAGDQMIASVTVKGKDVTLRIRDLSTGTSVSKTKRVSKLDISSADWIVEAPASCATAGRCTILPLAKFGTVAFSQATATAKQHTGTIDDADWTLTAIELQQQAGVGARGPGAFRDASARAVTSATPSPVSSADGSFAVSWHEQSVQVEPRTAPTLPGFDGGAP